MTLQLKFYCKPNYTVIFLDFDLESFMATDLNSMHAESIAQDLVKSDAVQLRLEHHDEQ